MRPANVRGRTVRLREGRKDPATERLVLAAAARDADRAGAIVRQALRAATAERHARLDQAFSRFDLGERASYCKFLRAHARVLPALEARACGAGVWGAFEPRVAWLMADLAAVGAAPPQPITVPSCPDAAAAWGLLYVLEGARLGGALLARRVGPGLPRDYLSAGHADGSWRRFLAALEEAGAAGGAGWLAAAATGATEAFDWFARAAPMESEAEHAR